MLTLYAVIMVTVTLTYRVGQHYHLVNLVTFDTIRVL